jgi:hypothetical protein
MRRPSQDTLKLGAALVLLGAANIAGWTGLAAVLANRWLERPPGFWSGISVMLLANLLLAAIVGLLAWVLSDQTRPRLDA